MAGAYAGPPQTMGSLREYVTGESRMQQAADSTVLLVVTHNHLKARFPEIRLDKHVSRGVTDPWGVADAGTAWRARERVSACPFPACCTAAASRRRARRRRPPPLARPRSQMTVGAVKAKITTHTGTPPDTMALQLRDEGGRAVAALDDDARKLGYYGPRNGWVRRRGVAGTRRGLGGPRAGRGAPGGPRAASAAGGPAARGLRAGGAPWGGSRPVAAAAAPPACG
jgi:hypothetical protein